MQTVFPSGRDGAAPADRTESSEKTMGSGTEWCRSGEMLLAQGDYAGAIPVLRRAIELNPCDAGVHHRLALAFAGCGKQQEAVEACMQALAVKPDYPEVLNDLGGILAGMGQTAEAVRCFERAVQIDPKFTTAVNNLGLLRFGLGDLNEAATLFRRVLALQPDRAETLFDLGKVLWLQGAIEESAACFRCVVRLRPKSAEVHYHLGIVLAGMGKHAEAIQAYERTLSIKPDYLEALNNLGSILKERGDLAEARACFERAMQIDPNNPVVINNLGLAHYSLGHLDEAAALYRKALALQSNFPEALSNLGQVLRMQSAVEESIVCCRKALDLRPDYPEALSNLGSGLYDSGRLPEAISLVRRAVGLQQDSPGFHLDLGMLLLTAGCYEEGWREYEWRWERAELKPKRAAFTQALWRGETAAGKVLLLWAEQGFGDTLQFCRYAPMAAERGLRVILMVQPPLMRLLTSLPGVEAVIGSDCATLPAHDYQCPLMSLPLAFDTRLESIPAGISYLTPPEDAVLSWKKRLQDNSSGNLRVGLVWAGNTWRHIPLIAALDRRRSLVPEMLSPFLDVPGVDYFSLQKDGSPAPAEFGFADFMNECRDFADTAALVANLDLIVSVDTAVAHLAAAVGTPVWLLSRYANCWRWLWDREDSPWYPTLRLFRQPRPGDWESVIGRVRTELGQHAAEHAAAVASRGVSTLL